MVNYITKEMLDKYVKGKKVIELKDFAELFEKEFGIIIPLWEEVNYAKLSEVQKEKFTKAIFSNEDVLEQLRKATTNVIIFRTMKRPFKL